MDYERLLLSKTAQTGRIQQLLSAGVRDDHFSNEEVGHIFRFMAEHAKRYKQPPSFSTVREQFPDYNFELTDESHEYLLEQFLKGVKRIYAFEAFRDLAEALDDPDQISNIDGLFLEKSRELATIVPSQTLSRFSDMDERIAKYENTSPEEAKGIYMGVPYIDNLTMGYQPHEYITIMGWSGTGKSTLAQWNLYNAWYQGKTPMYISLEMEAEALFRKWDTMATQFEYNKLKAIELSGEDVEKWKEKAEEVKSRDNDIIVLDDVRGLTVDKVYSELVRWQPDICCIDYITLMNTERSSNSSSWEKIMNLTRALKQTARTMKIPIIGVAQTNRLSKDMGAELDNVGFSVAIVQDSDIVLGLHSDQEMRDNKQMELRLLKNRDGATGDTRLLWDMTTMNFGPWAESMAFRETYA